MRQLHHAIVLAAAADADEVDYAYGEAVAEGAMSTLGCPGCERAHGTLRLLTLALLRLPELAVQAHLIDVNDARPDGFRRATADELANFRDALRTLEVPVVRRYSGGAAKHAACGMLASTCHPSSSPPNR